MQAVQSQLLRNGCSLRQVLLPLAGLQNRQFGNFELYHPIPPRYFLVKYELDQRKFREKVLDSPGKEIAIEHSEKVKRAVQDQQIVFRGEMLPQRTESTDESGEQEQEGTTAVAQASDLDEIIFVFNGRDERDPHRFIMDDPLFTEGVIKEWKIEELDLIHKERDDELTITGKM